MNDVERVTEMRSREKILRKRILTILTLILLIASFSIIITSIVYLEMARATGDLYANGWISDVGSIGEVVVAVVAAIIITIQLKQEKEIEKEENRISEADFILRYNNIFLGNSAMQEVQEKLTKHYMNIEELTEDDVYKNLQEYVNYLVYLEGIAPLILNGVIDLKHVDDLFAYRYFIAMNNPVLQKISLQKFPQHYRGCYKLYRVWRDYRVDYFCNERKEKYTELIPLCETELDCVEEYRHYGEIVYSGDSTCKTLKDIRTVKGSQMYTIAKLLFWSNEEMYLKMYGSRINALETIVQALEKNNNPIFNSWNIKIIERKGIIESVVLDINKNKSVSCEEYMKWLKEKNSNAALYEAEIKDYVRSLIDGKYEIGIDNVYMADERKKRKNKIKEIIKKKS